MNRSREAIRKYLIRLGYISKPVKRKAAVVKTRWFDYCIPSFHNSLFIFMTLAMIISGLYMSLICLAFILIISDLYKKVINDYFIFIGIILSLSIFSSIFSACI